MVLVRAGSNMLLAALASCVTTAWESRLHQHCWLGCAAQSPHCLQRKLDAEKAQRIADISRTTHTHANLLADANQRIKQLEVGPL